MKPAPLLDYAADICRNKHGGNPESRAANRRVTPTKALVRARILSLAEANGAHGITADEVAAFWGCGHNHVAPRISELLASGELERSDQRRKTRSGCSARVVVVAKRVAA